MPAANKMKHTGLNVHAESLPDEQKPSVIEIPSPTSSPFARWKEDSEVGYDLFVFKKIRARCPSLCETFLCLRYRYSLKAVDVQTGQTE